MSVTHFYQLLNYTESQLYKLKTMLPPETYVIEAFYISDKGRVF